MSIICDRCEPGVPTIPAINQNQSGRGCGAIEHNIVKCSSSRGDVALMPLIERSDKGSSNPSRESPLRRPAFKRRPTGAPSAKKQPAENAVTENVSGLTGEPVPEFKAGGIERPEEPGEEREKKTAGVTGREQVRGLGGDNKSPENGREPCFPRGVL